jgi:hypothetical protein
VVNSTTSKSGKQQGLLYLRAELHIVYRVDCVSENDFWQGQRAGVWPADEAPYILFLWLDKLTNSCSQKKLASLRLKNNQRIDPPE